MITAVRGTYDILPADAPLWQFVEARAHAVFPRYGFSELRTPKSSSKVSSLRSGSVPTQATMEDSVPLSMRMMDGL